MKIDPGDRVFQGAPAPQPKIENKPGTVSFAEVLERNVQKATGEKVRHASAIQPALRPCLVSSDRYVADQTDRMLAAMESYQQLLANPEISLRRVEPAFRQVKKELSALEPIVGDLPDSHPVRQVADQTILAAAKEIARFESGVYVVDGTESTDHPSL